MRAITFSVLSNSAKTLKALQELLAQFEARHHIHVELRLLTWATAWDEYARMAVDGDVPDVSEVGTTWVSPLAAMNVLRPYNPSELGSIGGPGVFHGGIWRTCVDPRSVWAMPWLLDTRLIWYWRDMITAAGIPEAGAFSSHDEIARTFERLKAAGVAPWVTPTLATRVTLQNAASWVWAYGGDVLHAQRPEVVFDQPEALAGFKAFFGLYRLLAPDLPGVNDLDADALFRDRRAAVAVAGPWIPDVITGANDRLPPELGVAPMPGWSWMGGSNLIVWRRSLQELAALDLVRFLTSSAAQSVFARVGSLMPTRLDVLTDPALTSDPIYQTMSTNAQRGRIIPAPRLWGVIELQLRDTLAVIGREVLASPDSDLDAILRRHLIPVARRLNTMLAT